MKKKLCVFDFDGTLVDTREFILQAFEYTLKAHGLVVPTREELLTKIGKPLAVDYQTITGLQDVEKLLGTHRAFQNENQNLVILFPNVKEVLEELRKNERKIVVATTRSKITSLASIEQVGIVQDVDLILSIEDVAAARPDPDCIKKSMEYFSIPPEETFMIGDRAIDIEAGKNAHVQTIGVVYGIEGTSILNSSPDYSIVDIKELLPLI